MTNCVLVSGGKFKDGEKRKDGKDEKKKKKLKKREKEGGKVEKKKKMHKSRDMVDEEEDDCSAVKCLKPSGERFCQSSASVICNCIRMENLV